MDKILRGLICGGQVSLTVLDVTALVNEAIKIHGTSPAASRILGGILACGAYLSTLIKGENGAVSLTVKAKDGDGAVSVSGDKALHIRGYADGSCEQTLRGGSLTVVRDDGFAAPYVGTCEIESDDVSAILETYFGQSEQIPTAACISADIDPVGKCRCAGGVVMQLLPGAEDENIRVAGEAFERFSREGSVALGADRAMESFFKPLLSGEAYELHPEYKCNCSEEKIRGVLASVGRAELLKMATEQGEVRVHCHYCNRDYVYDKKRIEETFTE